MLFFLQKQQFLILFRVKKPFEKKISLLGYPCSFFKIILDYPDSQKSSNLETILGTQNVWQLLTVGRCSDVVLCIKLKIRSRNAGLCRQLVITQV
jgi:hypothetical protein